MKIKHSYNKIEICFEEQDKNTQIRLANALTELLIAILILTDKGE